MNFEEELKSKILEKLALIIDSRGRLPLNNLELIVNSGETTFILGQNFINLLEEIKKEGLIKSDDKNWYFSITKSGLNFLSENSKK